MIREMNVTRRGEGAIPKPVLDSIQRGHMAYTYKSIPTFKSPSSMTMYTPAASQLWKQFNTARQVLMPWLEPSITSSGLAWERMKSGEKERSKKLASPR
jgi:hypothetical protein